MTRLAWDNTDKNSIDVGIDRGVIYPPNEIGTAWNGLVSVSVSEDSREARSYFLDGQKVAKDPISGDFEATIQAYIYPDEFDRTRDIGFGLSYRTIVKTETEDYYKIHILYDVLATDKERVNTTISENPNAIIFEWDLTSLPTNFDGLRPLTHLIIDSRSAYPWLLKDLETQLYGSAFTDARLPDLQEIFDIFEESSILKITNHGDGTWTAEGPPVYMIGPTEFAIDWASIVYLNSETYRVSSF